mmetsp:Transcript_17669/g.43537  ORF Transcript_17669/g.43537 Transcript_17669/m.43537 type:complete len:82 (+) Transcript_17669:934-1179(+)
MWWARTTLLSSDIRHRNSAIHKLDGPRRGVIVVPSSAHFGTTKSSKKKYPVRLKPGCRTTSNRCGGIDFYHDSGSFATHNK